MNGAKLASCAVVAFAAGAGSVQELVANLVPVARPEMVRGGSPPPGSWINIDLRGPVAGDPFLDITGTGYFDLGDLIVFFNRFDVAGG